MGALRGGPGKSTAQLGAPCASVQPLPVLSSQPERSSGHTRTRLTRARVEACAQGKQHNCLVDQEGWVIHGLWPSNWDGSYPASCDSSKHFDETAIAPIEDQLDRYWPNSFADTPHTNFWEHEWCAPLPGLWREERSWWAHTGRWKGPCLQITTVSDSARRLSSSHLASPPL